MKKKILIIGSAVVILAIGFFVFRSLRSADKTISFETAILKKGDVSNSVTATGTLEAIKTVAVGTQVSGVIEKIYVDFNSRVKKGQLLAQLDETPLLAQLAQSEASVDQAEAQEKYQKATYDRYKILVGKKLIAQSDFDLAEYNYNNAVAALKNAQSVNDRNKINLSYARIYSPIDGVILNRAVDEGQTVAASFNTPTLFSIANDLTHMQVQANVDEADIGQVKLDQRVEFTVDAYPDQKFSGSVVEIRMQPVVTSNVVTYTVIVNAPNPDIKLMPGMTASISIYVNEKKNVLVVPGKALRFTPEQDIYSNYLKKLPENISKEMSPKLPVAKPASMTMPAIGEKEKNFVWIKKGDVIERKEVELGNNDGINYEMVSGLNEGDDLVLSMTEETLTPAAKKATRSPFMPQRPGSQRKK